MPSTNLCATDELKRHLSIDSDDHDDLLNDIIAGASDAMEKFCRTTFSPTERTEYIDGTGANDILLSHTPIIEILDLRVAPDHQFESAEPIPEDNLMLHEDIGAVALISGIFYKGIRNVRAQYLSGHESVPSGVRSACVRLSAAWFNRARQGGDGLSGESFGDYSVRYEPMDFPADVRRILRPYLQPNI